MVAYFYPRSPCGERRFELSILHPAVLFLSTLSLRRATVTVLGIQHRVGISIHALLAESDALIRYLVNTYHNFYPRSPCGERPAFDAAWRKNNGFLSTLSLRRATEPRPPEPLRHPISIHALLAESDKDRQNL